MSSDSVDNWIVGFMTALAPGLAHLASDFQMVDTQYVLFLSAANVTKNQTNIKKQAKMKNQTHIKRTNIKNSTMAGHLASDF